MQMVITRFAYKLREKMINSEPTDSFRLFRVTTVEREKKGLKTSNNNPVIPYLYKSFNYSFN